MLVDVSFLVQFSDILSYSPVLKSSQVKSEKLRTAQAIRVLVKSLESRVGEVVWVGEVAWVGQVSWVAGRLHECPEDIVSAWEVVWLPRRLCDFPRGCMRAREVAWVAVTSHEYPQGCVGGCWSVQVVSWGHRRFCEWVGCCEWPRGCLSAWDFAIGYVSWKGCICEGGCMSDIHCMSWRGYIC